MRFLMTREWGYEVRFIGADMVPPWECAVLEKCKWEVCSWGVKALFVTRTRVVRRVHAATALGAMHAGVSWVDEWAARKGDV